MDKDIDAFRTISEVAEDLDLPQHVLRFWELRFPQIKPMKRSGGRRYYRPEDLDLLRGIKHLLYGEGYTIKGVQRILKEQGVRTVVSAPHGGENGPPPARKEPATRAKPPAVAEAADEEAETAQELSGVGIAPNQAQRLRALLLDIEDCGRILAAAREG